MHPKPGRAWLAMRVYRIWLEFRHTSDYMIIVENEKTLRCNVGQPSVNEYKRQLDSFKEGHTYVNENA